jgi:hypothetical protein
MGYYTENPSKCNPESELEGFHPRYQSLQGEIEKKGGMPIDKIMESTKPFASCKTHISKEEEPK